MKSIGHQPQSSWDLSFLWKAVFYIVRWKTQLGRGLVGLGGWPLMQSDGLRTPPMNLSPLKPDGTLPIVTLHFLEPFLTNCCCSETTLLNGSVLHEIWHRRGFAELQLGAGSGGVTIVLLLMFGGAHGRPRQPQMQCMRASGNSCCQDDNDASRSTVIGRNIDILIYTESFHRHAGSNCTQVERRILGHRTVKEKKSYLKSLGTGDRGPSDEETVLGW